MTTLSLEVLCFACMLRLFDASSVLRHVCMNADRNADCRRIWTVFYSKDYQARFLKVTSLQKVQLLKDCTRFHRFTKGSQIIKMATRTQHNTFFWSPRRASELLDPYVIAHTDSCGPRMGVKPVNISKGVIYRTIIYVGFIFNFLDFFWVWLITSLRADEIKLWLTP